jgi:hypothetical protein
VGPTCQPAEEIKERVGQLSGPVERGRGPAEIKEKEKEGRRRGGGPRGGMGQAGLGQKEKEKERERKGWLRTFLFFKTLLNNFSSPFFKSNLLHVFTTRFTNYFKDF